MRNNVSLPPSFESDEDRTWFRVRLPVHEEFARAEEYGGEQDAEQDTSLKIEREMSSALQVTDQVKQLVLALTGEMQRQQLQDVLRIGHRPHFRQQFIHPALEAGLIEMTLPDKPSSSKQRYRRTPAGEALARQIESSHP